MSKTKYREPAPFTETTAIFIESDQFHDVTDAGWYPFLPKPGTYEHPKFGDVVIDEARNMRMVDSITSQVYQEKVPIDLEHDLKVSGAVGWVSNARMNPDGSADAFIEWTDRGQEVLQGDRFRYISPEWFRQWKDPASGQEHRDVVAGGALTTRPFFKDKVLRALVASERGVEVVGRKTQKFAGENGEPEDEELDDEAEDDDAAEGDEPEADADAGGDDGEDDDAEGEESEGDEEEGFTEMPEGFTEAQAFAIEDYVERRIASVTESFAEALQQETERGNRAEKALKVLQGERRHERFTEIVRNRDAGAPFLGGIDTQVQILERFADTFGESSAEFKGYVETQKAAAEQVKTSQAFSEIGSGASVATSEPVKRLEAMADELRKTKPELSKQQAFSEVLDTPEGARLYAESLGN